MKVKVLIEVSGASHTATAYEDGSHVASARATSLKEVLRKIKTRVLEQLEEPITWEVYDLQGKEYVI